MEAAGCWPFQVDYGVHQAPSWPLLAIASLAGARCVAYLAGQVLAGWLVAAALELSGGERGAASW
eukprot:2971624-Alexandrium_andersonii.AAC.1